MLKPPKDDYSFEYEHLYNIRDQTLLFLKLGPNTTGFTNELLCWLDEKLKILEDKINPPDNP